MVSLSSLRGYVLEELLASLLQSSGYDLIVHSSQDPAALTMAGNGLRIRGRGADHQVDVLGQLRIRIPFMHRLRLFVEAKYRSEPSGLGDVRNAIGVINDVNEHYSWAAAQNARPNYVRYHYRYALFSATGFTEGAQRYAITQQVSLIDLSTPAFEWLLNAADRVARALISLWETLPSAGAFPVAQVREALRRAMGTWPLDPRGAPQNFTSAAERASEATSASDASLPIRDLARIASEAADLSGGLYLGFTDTPFILILQPDDVDAVAEFLHGPSGREREPAELRFGGRNISSGEWVMVATDPNLSFRLALPPDFESLILGFDPESEISTRGMQMDFYRSVTIAAADGDAELRYAPVPVIQEDVRTESAGAYARDYSRSSRLDPELAFRSEERPAGLVQWTSEAVVELLRRLRSEGWPHAAIIERAAANGGAVTRAEVYEIAGYPPERMLRGFTRPTRRITLDLIVEGLIDEDVDWPLLTQYATGVVASHFIVPPEFTDTLEA
jgi:hypothetical protein